MNIEQLKKECEARGISKARLNNNANMYLMSVIAEILSQNDNGVEITIARYNELVEMRKENQKAIEALKADYEAKIIEAENKIREASYIEKENKMLYEVKECETAEARDKVRLAAIYVRAFDKGLNEYQFTEYIKGLGEILSAG